MYSTSIEVSLPVGHLEGEARGVQVKDRRWVNAAADLLVKKNLRLIRRQIDIDGGRQHGHFEHGGRVAVPRRVVRVLSAVVLPQQLACGGKNTNMFVSYIKSLSAGISQPYEMVSAEFQHRPGTR